MKQQTAVEWLIEQTRKPEWHSLKRQDILDEALEKEKQQIIDAYDSEEHDLCGCGSCSYCSDIDDRPVPTGEQYFSETFKQD